MNTTSSSLVPALISMSAGLWIVRAGIAKRLGRILRDAVQPPRRFQRRQSGSVRATGGSRMAAAGRMVSPTVPNEERKT